MNYKVFVIQLISRYTFIIIIIIIHGQSEKYANARYYSIATITKIKMYHEYNYNIHIVYK